MVHRANPAGARYRLALFWVLWPAQALVRADERLRGLQRQRAVPETVLGRRREQGRGRGRRVYREGKRSSQLNRGKEKSAGPKE